MVIATPPSSATSRKCPGRAESTARRRGVPESRDHRQPQLLDDQMWSRSAAMTPRASNASMSALSGGVGHGKEATRSWPRNGVAHERKPVEPRVYPRRSPSMPPPHRRIPGQRLHQGEMKMVGNAQDPGGRCPSRSSDRGRVRSFTSFRAVHIETRDKLVPMRRRLLRAAPGVVVVDERAAAAIPRPRSRAPGTMPFMWAGSARHLPCARPEP